MSRLVFLAFLMMWATVAFGQISRPTLGYMVDSDGDLRPVYGVPASTTLGDPLVSGVVSAACSANLCLAKAAGAIWSSGLLSDGSSDAKSVLVSSAPAGSALFAFAGIGAYVYFPTTSALMWWQKGQLSPFAFAPDGEILALNSTGDGLDYAVRRDGGTWLEHVALDGTTPPQPIIKNALDAVGPVMLLDSGVVATAPMQASENIKIAKAATTSTIPQRALPPRMSQAGTVHFQRPDGTQTSFPIGDVLSFTRISDGYVQVTTRDGVWAIRTEIGSERSFLLPGISAPSVLARPVPPRTVIRTVRPIEQQ